MQVIVLLAGKSRPVLATGARVSVEGNMSHPGMVPVFGTAVEVRPGRYEAPLTLTMGGDWVLTVKATLADGRRLSHEVKLPAVKGS